MAFPQHVSTATFGKAVIIGGGIAGLAAARMVADCFSEVLILERGKYPEEPVFRKETPQARHRHSISETGRQVLGEMFPDLDVALEAAGCPAVSDMQPDTCHNVDFVITRAYDAAPVNGSGLKKRLVSRPRLEWEMRQRVAQIRNVQIVQECQVEGLLPSQDKSRIEGVATRIKGQLHHFQADLVIEASGRHSRIVHWLESMGGQPLPESVLDSKFLMVGCQYEIPRHFPSDWITLFIQARPPYNFREAFLSRIEDKYLLLTVSGLQGHYPPAKNHELLNYLKQLRKSGIYDIVKNLTPLGAAYGYGHTDNRRRHFERMTLFPDNLVVMGDAACCLNPAYGFGMELAAQAAETLQETLTEQKQQGSLTGISNRFHAALAMTVDATWQKVINKDKVFLAETAVFSAITIPSRPLLQKEPHVYTWDQYADEASQTDAFQVLRQKLVQLQFPIQAGIHQTADYKNATQRGLLLNNPTSDCLTLEEPASLKVEVYKGAVGYVPILQTKNRADFEKLVQALANRNEPVVIPESVNLYFVSRLNNWDRIRLYKENWIKGKREASSDSHSWEDEWTAVFKKLAAQKSLYQDCFIISENRLHERPLPNSGHFIRSWLELSTTIHNEYAATHYFLAHLGLSKRNLPLHNELIAYYAGLVMAMGEFRKEWLFQLINPHLRKDDTYLLECAAEHIEIFDHRYGANWHDPDGVALMIYALDSLSFEELAADSAVHQLTNTLEHLQA